MTEPVLLQAEDQPPQQHYDEQIPDPVHTQPEDNGDALSGEELQSDSSGDESDPNDMDIDMPSISEPQNVLHAPSCNSKCAPCRLKMCLIWDKKELKCNVKKLDFVRLAPDSCGFLVDQDIASNVTCGSCVLIDAYLHEGVEIPWETLINNPPWLSDAQTMIDSAIKHAKNENATIDMLGFIRYHVQHQRELESYAAVDPNRELCVSLISKAIHRLFKEQLSVS